MVKILSVLSALFFSVIASAHCPTSFKEEKACLMLEHNVVYIYDEKQKHSGPYKDLTENTLVSIKSLNAPVTFSKAARGVYKLDTVKPIKVVDIEMANGTKKIILKLKAE